MSIARTLLAALALCVTAAPAVADPPLTVTVFTGSAAGLHATSTLVAGARDAILIDAQLDRADAYRLAAMIFDSGKTLTTVYVTHAHADHYFGLIVLRQAFPKARFIALPAVAAEIKSTWKRALAQWRSRSGDQLAGRPVLPTAYRGRTLELDGQVLELRGPRQGDVGAATYVWIPSIQTVVTGDIVWNGVHPWTADTGVDQRSAWIATIDEIRGLAPVTVIAGHKDPTAQDAAPSLVGTRDYLVTFDGAVESSTSAAEVEQKLKARFPSLLLPMIAQVGAAAQFPVLDASR